MEPHSCSKHPLQSHVFSRPKAWAAATFTALGTSGETLDQAANNMLSHSFHLRNFRLVLKSDCKTSFSSLMLFLPFKYIFIFLMSAIWRNFNLCFKSVTKEFEFGLMSLFYYISSTMGLSHSWIVRIRKVIILEGLRTVW